VRELCAVREKIFGMKVRVGGGIRTVSRAEEIADGVRARSFWKRRFP